MNLRKPFSMEENSNLTDLGLLILRVGMGFTMAYGHGLGKFTKLFSGNEIKFMDFLGMGPTVSLGLVVFAELVCSVLLMLGLFTRWVSFPLLFTMCVAVFVVHINDDFGKMEKGLMYLFAYLTLFLAGGGRYSLDAMLGKGK